MSPEFLITSLVVVIAPGTGVIYTLAVALAHGRRAALAAAFGCTLGILPHMAAAILGAAALLHASALAFQGVKILGVAYLLYLAWTTLRQSGALRVEATGDARSAVRVATTGFLINILNPKLSIFFLAFLPQFVSANTARPIGDMVLLSLVFMAMTLVVFAAYGIAAAAVRAKVLSRPKVMAWLRRVFAATFVGLSVRLALAER